MELNSNFKISFLFVLVGYAGGGGGLVFWVVCLGFFVTLFVCGLVVCFFQSSIPERSLYSGAQNSFLGRILLWTDDLFLLYPLLSEISGSDLGFKGLVMELFAYGTHSR